MSPRSTALALATFLMLAIGACSAVRPVADERSPGYLTFEVAPSDAEVYIDEDYRGHIDGWRGQTIPVEPGPRRVELRAKGYMTQRFDIEVRPGDQLTLELRLERELDDLPLDEKESRSSSR